MSHYQPKIFHKKLRALMAIKTPRSMTLRSFIALFKNQNGEVFKSVQVWQHNSLLQKPKNYQGIY